MFAQSLINTLLTRSRKKQIPFVIIYQQGTNVQIESNVTAKKVGYLVSVALDHCQRQILKKQVEDEAQKGADVTTDRKDD